MPLQNTAFDYLQLDVWCCTLEGNTPAGFVAYCQAITHKEEEVKEHHRRSHHVLQDRKKRVEAELEVHVSYTISGHIIQDILLPASFICFILPLSLSFFLFHTCYWSTILISKMWTNHICGLFIAKRSMFFLSSALVMRIYKVFIILMCFE